MIKKYVKKPVEVEALQWTGDNIDDMCAFIGIDNVDFPNKTEDDEIGVLFIKSPFTELSIYVPDNFFVIKDSNGDCYTCSPEKFREEYYEGKLFINV